MTLPTRPFIVVYVAWHPAFEQGSEIARAVYDHFRRKLFENASGGAGLSVQYRSQPATGSDAPLPIDFAESDTAAVVVLFDANFANDPSYRQWYDDLAARSDAQGLGTRVFPVAIDDSLTHSGIVEQAVRWDRMKEEVEGRRRKLISELTYQFTRMLRLYLERLRHPGDPDEELGRYLKKVEVFLSHSKRDDDGERIANAIRRTLFETSSLSSFFDVHDISPGLRFDKVIVHKIRTSAVVAIHTDSFSSREWCRREIIEAKRASVPLVIANCLTDLDERGFPYMGNVPVVRMDPAQLDRIEQVIGHLLDEVLKDFLWRCRIALLEEPADGTVQYLPRPPELISLVGLDRSKSNAVTVVYPDPPLGAEEQRLFEELVPDLRMRSLTEWIALSGDGA
ncbi:hypothetical protein J2X48_005258 [Bosea sp. BE271]|uniref:toll/interleukin-1 receptor domain-containing protein n=1 Tax=Bosea TaxID=85413 RepID=UPI002741F529|nr:MULTISPECIES: toll/interleukin-1 receptor domain-containing protein [Bosea]MDR6831576.1 hypothetical protein [Bosea robiniae]MDR6898285.1 hypothetical protein [Bosea sp. BE109]MDR7141672.1 hypothetical protein [Bosea sp. BE168]MDR7178305.1 hypothetical protein [Bosea sp. BE271]